MGNQILKNDWAPLLNGEFQKPYYLQLREFLKVEYANQIIYPPMEDLFNALHYTQYEDVKVVILGQDPYHGAGQAHGLSFSVNPQVPVPPSLKNIFKELQTDIGCTIPNNGYLVPWAKQGVLLLNTVLTVRESQPASHRNKGWEQFTDDVIRTISHREKPVVFILWGRHAQGKKKLIDLNKHLIIESAHPSPLSAHRGFFGTKPFSQANTFLQENGEQPIDWQIPHL